MASLSIREIATGYTDNSRPGSGWNISRRFTVQSSISHLIVCAFLMMLPSVPASITNSSRTRLFQICSCRQPAVFLHHCAITASIRAARLSLSFCLGTWRRVARFNRHGQFCCWGRDGDQRRHPAGSGSEGESIRSHLKGSQLLRGQGYPGIQQWPLSCPPARFAEWQLWCHIQPLASASCITQGCLLRGKRRDIMGCPGLAASQQTWRGQGTSPQERLVPWAAASLHSGHVFSHWSTLVSTEIALIAGIVLFCNRE